MPLENNTVTKIFIIYCRRYCLKKRFPLIMRKMHIGLINLRRNAFFLEISGLMKFKYIFTTRINAINYILSLVKK